MEVVHERCCGLDVHKKVVVACLLTPGEGGRPERKLKSFGTTTRQLLALAEWLMAAGCTHVAMESTGSYWKPIYNLLEDQFELLLVNAQHVKAVPGRKSDVRDAEWIAQLLRHGLVRGSFVPARAARELRELVRYRTSLIRERSSEINRIQKILEGANIKLASVASNVVGISGRLMLEAMVGGVDDPGQIADLARGRLRHKIPALEEALAGRMTDTQRFMLAEQLRHLDDLDGSISRVSAQIAERLRPFEDIMERLATLPGIARRTAEIVVAEIGTDVTAFPSAGHLASWAGLCPGQDESAGKRRSGRTRKGNAWLRSALIESAQTVGRTKTHLGEQYHRIGARRGKRRAAVAVAHSLIIIIYHLLKSGRPFEDLGYRYLDERQAARATQRYVRMLANLGYTVTLEPAA